MKPYRKPKSEKDLAERLERYLTKRDERIGGSEIVSRMKRLMK